MEANKMKRFLVLVSVLAIGLTGCTSTESPVSEESTPQSPSPSQTAAPEPTIDELILELEKEVAERVDNSEPEIGDALTSSVKLVDDVLVIEYNESPTYSQPVLYMFAWQNISFFVELAKQFQVADQLQVQATMWMVDLSTGSIDGGFKNLYKVTLDGEALLAYDASCISECEKQVTDYKYYKIKDSLWYMGQGKGKVNGETLAPEN